jgi:hypothetical protein
VPNGKVQDWRYGKIQLEWLPALSAIPRNVDTCFSSGEKQIFSLVILANDAGKRSHWNAIVDPGPTLAVIRGLVESRSFVIEFVTGCGDIHRPLFVRGDFNSVYKALFQILRSDIFPVATSIPGEVDKSVVAASPDDPFFMGRFGNVAERSIVLCPHRLNGIRATPMALFVILVASQIGGSFFPGLPHIPRPQQILCAVVESAGFMF